MITTELTGTGQGIITIRRVIPGDAAFCRSLKITGDSAVDLVCGEASTVADAATAAFLDATAASPPPNPPTPSLLLSRPEADPPRGIIWRNSLAGESPAAAAATEVGLMSASSADRRSCEVEEEEAEEVDR